jgi:hypothetical protein
VIAIFGVRFAALLVSFETRLAGQGAGCWAIWFLLGAFLIQIRGGPVDGLRENGAGISRFADGRPVTLTGG